MQNEMQMQVAVSEHRLAGWTVRGSVSGELSGPTFEAQQLNPHVMRAMPVKAFLFSNCASAQKRLPTSELHTRHNINSILSAHIVRMFMQYHGSEQRDAFLDFLLRLAAVSWRKLHPDSSCLGLVADENRLSVRLTIKNEGAGDDSVGIGIYIDFPLTTRREQHRRLCWRLRKKETVFRKSQLCPVLLSYFSPAFPPFHPPESLLDFLPHQNTFKHNDEFP